jgi:enamine deaminase RidA (YjgF/YER057c/UK114 family)
MYSILISDVGKDQVHITAAVDGNKGSASAAAEGLYRELASILHSQGLQILHERVYGKLDFYERFVEIRGECLNLENEPFSYVEGQPCRGSGLAGIQVHAAKAAANEDIWTVCYDNRPCGRSWKRQGTTYVYLAGITGSKPAGCRYEQTMDMFEKIDRILASQNLRFGHVVRTWIYLEDILDWYDKFNSIRTNTLMELGLIPDRIDDSEIDTIYLPASTGISGKNPDRLPSLCDVLAIAGDLQATILPGVSQRSAFRYGSAFSRGVYVEEKEYCQIFVSGTAAIDDRGNSLFPENVEAQITRTVESVEALIGEKGASLNDICCATVFLKRPEDLAVFKKVAKRFDLKHLPAVYVTADICRRELLFEMDALAVVT